MRSFELNEKEEKRFLSFYNKKKKEWKKKDPEKIIIITFCFTPTGIGDNITLKCFDGEEKDITDYDSW